MPEFTKHPVSLFVKNGWVEVSDNAVRRVVTSAGLSAILQSPFFAEGVKKGFWPAAKLIDAKPSYVPFQKGSEEAWYYTKYQYDFDMAGFRQVFEVERLPFISQFNEWAPRQFIDVLRHICNTEIFCLQNGVCIKDPSPMKVMFFRGAPIHIDLGSFRIYDGSRREYLYGHLPGWFLYKSCNHMDWFSSICKNAGEIVKQLKTLAASRAWAGNVFEQFLQVIDTAELIYPPDRWSKYTPECQEDMPVDFEAAKDLRGAKSRTVYDTLAEIQPSSVVDIGCSSGFFSFMAESLGATTVGIDSCRQVIEMANKHASERGANCIFLSFDVMNPPNPVGRNGIRGTSESRLNAECGIAAAILHHLYRQEGSVGKVIAKLSEYAQKWLLLEYIPANDEHVRASGWSDKWFSRDGVMAALFDNDWRLVRVGDSRPAPREWWILKRKG